MNLNYRIAALVQIVLILALLAFAAGCGGEETQLNGSPQVHFPEDEGAHPTFLIEWWYGNFSLTDSEGGEYGAMVAYFRPFLKIVSISDLEAERFYHEVFMSTPEYAEGALDLHWDDSDRWSRTNPDALSYRLESYGSDIGLDLDIDSRKPPLMVGGDGLIEWVEGSSYYYSLTRLQVEGHIEIPERTINVTGTGWMDHQWMDALSEGGWDWFSVQLDNDTEIIFWHIVNPDEAVKSMDMTMMFPDSSVYHTEDFILERLDSWVSPESGNDYGVLWGVHEDTRGLDLEISARYNEQEILMNEIMPGSDWAFWEGNTIVSGQLEGENVSGSTYAELVRFPSSDDSQQ